VGKYLKTKLEEFEKFYINDFNVKPINIYILKQLVTLFFIHL